MTSQSTTTITTLERKLNNGCSLHCSHFLCPPSIYFHCMANILYILWYILNTNSGISAGISWQERALITFEIQSSTPDWKEM